MKKYMTLAGLVLLGVFSCQKNETPAQSESAEKNIQTFSCVIAPDENPESKVAIANDGKATWVNEDKLFIHGKVFSEGKTVKLETENISGNVATFSVDLTDVEVYNPDKYYIQYPAEAACSNSGDRTYYYNTFSNTNAPLVAGYLSGSTFKLYNLTAAISFIVNAEADVDSYVLTGNSGETVGYDHYAVKITSEETTYKHSSTTGDKTSVSGPVTADGTTINHIYIPNQVNFSSGFTITFLKGGVIQKTLSTNAATALTHGQLLRLGNVTAYLKDYVAPTAHPNTIGVAVASAIDLASTETANCYIVTEAGEYKFKATKGNSTTALSGISSVSVLWETANTSTAPEARSIIAAADYDQQDGEDPNIVFKTTTFKAGNAVIAAKDAADNIIWSWHIWMPETAIATSTYGDVATKPIMDRYLGALTVATEWATAADADGLSFGLLYQWGRKDPFPNVYDAGSRTAAKVTGEQFVYGTAKMSMADAIANPTHINALKDD